MAAVVKSLVFIFSLLSVCYCSSIPEFLETVMRLLNDCASFYPTLTLI